VVGSSFTGTNAGDAQCGGPVWKATLRRFAAGNRRGEAPLDGSLALDLAEMGSSTTGSDAV